MNKKAMAVAVAGALAAPGLAMAQASTVQVYGAVHILYHQLDRGTIAAGQTSNLDMLQTSDSSVGIRGEEKLGGGLSAWFQCESTFDIVGATASNGWCTRNTAIGFKGGWGNLFFGNWDTPLKLDVQNPVRGWWGLQNPYGISGQISNGGASGVINTGTSFSRRQAQSINYHSPSFGGFSAKGQYSSTNDSSSMSSGDSLNKARMWSIAARYDSGPLYVGIGYERHKNYNPANCGTAGTSGFCTQGVTYRGGDDRAWSLGASYTFAGVFRLSGLYSNMRYDTSTTTNLSGKGYGIYGDWTIAGPHSLKLGYTKAKDTGGNHAGGAGGTQSTVGFLIGNAGAGGTGSKLYAINYAYAFSKRTTGYIGWAKVKNDANANFPLQSSGPKPVFGDNQDIIGVGARHSF